MTRLAGVFVALALFATAGCEEDDGQVAGMDLKVVDLRIPSVTGVKQGNSITLTVLLKNNGTLPIEVGFATRVEFWEDQAGSLPSPWNPVELSYPADATYPALPPSRLAPGAIVALEAPTIVDASNPPQLVFCRAVCDSDGALYEVNEGNNYFLKACQVLPGTGGGGGGGGGEPVEPGTTSGPDPGISDINVPASVVRGNSLDVAITVRNYGDVSVFGVATVAVTVNEGTSYEFGDYTVEGISLAPDGTTSFEFSLFVDEEYPTGTAELVATLAIEIAGDEDADAANNEDRTTFQVTGPPEPDLVVTSVQSSDTYESGKELGLSVTFTLKNIGNAEAYGSMAHVLVCDEIQGLGDAVLVGEKPVSALAPGQESESYTVTCTYTAPSVGNYKVYVRADGLVTVAESNEGNNTEKYDITFVYF